MVGCQSQEVALVFESSPTQTLYVLEQRSGTHPTQWERSSEPKHHGGEQEGVN